MIQQRECSTVSSAHLQSHYHSWPPDHGFIPTNKKNTFKQVTSLL